MPRVMPPEPPFDFWRLRARLWHEQHDGRGPFEQAYHDEVDDELRHIMDAAGVNADSVEDRHWTGLADDDLVVSLRPIVGPGGFFPFRELRTYWLPFAASAASYYAAVVDRQPDPVALARRLADLREGLESVLKEQEGLLYRAWSKSPFRPRVPDAIGYFNGLDDAASGVLQALSTFEALERFIEAMGPRPANRSDVWTWTFIDSLARAYVRFTDTVPGAMERNIQPFRRFVDACWAAVFGEIMEERGDRVFRALCTEGPVLGARFRSFHDVLECTEHAFCDVIDSGPFDPEQKEIMKNAVYAGYMRGGLPLTSPA